MLGTGTHASEHMSWLDYILHSYVNVILYSIAVHMLYCLLVSLRYSPTYLMGRTISTGAVLNILVQLSAGQ